MEENYNQEVTIMYTLSIAPFLCGWNAPEWNFADFYVPKVESIEAFSYAARVWDRFSPTALQTKSMVFTLLFIKFTEYLI